jgi:hypothetical protein
VIAGWELQVLLSLAVEKPDTVGSVDLSGSLTRQVRWAPWSQKAACVASHGFSYALFPSDAFVLTNCVGQAVSSLPVTPDRTHIANMGGMVEAMETDLRSNMDAVS